MKINLLSIFLFFILFTAKGQNLVPNGDFEQYSGCPFAISQFDSALFWFNPTGASPDYFNACANPPGVSVPNNDFGYQQAHSGDGYCGVYSWVYGYTDYREYIEIQLSMPLISNMCYHLEMYFNSANNVNYITDAMGIYFSDTLITDFSTYFVLPFAAQINNSTGNMPDTINWKLLTGNFIANGGENYMIIGNFKNDSNTTVTMINTDSANYHAYVYIDDVSLTPCTGIDEFAASDEEFTVYPNPAGEELNVQYSMFNVQEKEINIYDMIGKEVLKTEVRSQMSEVRINISELQTGIYFIEINGVRKKFVKL